MQGVVVSLMEVTRDPECDIVLKIDFKEGEGSAARPFEIAASLIKALEEIDQTLVRSVDSRIETALIVEDLQKSSIKVFLRGLLNHADDEALKTLDWKPLVGQFLVKAKYAAIRWLDEDQPKLRDLTEEVARLAQDASAVSHFPLPAPPNPTRLASALDKWQRVKKEFKHGESLTITLERSEYSVALDRDWMPSERVEDLAGERELVSDAPTILVVRKPDMLGGTAWQFRLGKRSYTMPIEDEAWLADYHSRKVAIMPGDALQVIVRTESKFTEKGELMESKQWVIKVVKLIPQAPDPQATFLDD
jgi:hypothetical protein